MLYKKAVVKRLIINFENPTKEIVVFRRTLGIHKCYEIVFSDALYLDERCIYKNNCSLKYTCRRINTNPRYTSAKFEYIPTTYSNPY